MADVTETSRYIVMWFGERTKTFIL